MGALHNCAFWQLTKYNKVCKLNGAIGFMIITCHIHIEVRSTSLQKGVQSNVLIIEVSDFPNAGGAADCGKSVKDVE